MAKNKTLLDDINWPSDLKKLPEHNLEQLCQEIREHYVEVISQTGGHFAAGLGVIELTVAIHYLFDSPNDKLVWDVGHQAYVHKILTGRKPELPNIRKHKGISGFPKISESKYDHFGTGHASTAISAALGMAAASQLEGNYLSQHIAVVGDGALTGGLAFEGLNNAGVSSANLIIVLNDNSISIDPAVGALSQNFEAQYDSSRLKVSRGVSDGRTRRPRSAGYYKEKGIKATNISPQEFFESLNIPYHGPIDGNNLNELLFELKNLKAQKGPRILHIKTVKGKGYKAAEENQVTWHSPGKFDKLTGEIFKPKIKNPEPLKYQEVFGNTLVELAKINQKIVGITPAMPSGSSMNIFMKEFPERAFDVGIAEEHAVTFSAGLASKGLLPFCNIYSTFLQRAYDQIIHDVCLQKLKVVFCIDRAGIVGEDGPTHHGVFDLAQLRPIPNLIIASPKDEVELRNMMFTAQFTEDSMAIRYPRGKGNLVEWQLPMESIEIGKSEIIKEGNQIAVLALGNRVRPSIEAVEEMGLDATVVNMRFAKPLDIEMIKSLAKTHNRFITIEDGALAGGMGSAILEAVSDEGLNVKVNRLGFPDEFIEHGKPSELYAKYGLDRDGIQKTIKSIFE
ncbi:MAG: 1-deoxy-D-xylulose-5-phosphate synthase [Bacteroidia bacterium]